VPIDPITAAKGTGVAIAAATDRERRKWFADQWKKIRRRLHSGKLGIAIFGAGGVGKSTLGGMLDEKFDPSAPPREYKATVGTETFYLKTNDAQSVLVAAGQQERRVSSWQGIFENIQRTKKTVLIHVVAYGFHSSEGDISDFFAYQNKQRTEEVEILRDFANKLAILKLPNLKIITLVTKQDLWKSSEAQVKEFYEQSEYAKIISGIQSHFGSQNFSHEYIYSALVLQNLKDSRGNIKAETTSGYDDIEKMNSFKQFLELLEVWTK
jgi:GTPase SAR1 family protein